MSAQPEMPTVTSPRCHSTREARRLAAAVLAALGLLAGGGAQAEVADPSASRTIVVAKDKSAAFNLDFPISQIVVAQPDMLQLVATTDHSFYIRGKAVGVTNLLIYDKPHHLAQVVDVRIGQDTAALQEDLATALPGEHITANVLADGVLLSGFASTATAASRAMAIAERYAPKNVSSSIAIAADQQVMVEVRIIEVNKSSLRDIGVNLNGQNSAGSFGLGVGSQNGLQNGLTPQGVLAIGGKIGDVSLNARLSALEQKGLVRTLAKPNLMAMSGEEASFLAGGEFPYPIPNGLGTVSVEFRQFGVKLNVTPLVQDNGEIRLKVAPEVSQLDPQHSITISGFSLPSLTTSKASTTVELRDGQSFAIAGLFQSGYNMAANQVPGLTNLPVLGQLFRSTDWQHQQTELVIIVTPHLMTPADRVDQLPNPLAQNGPSDPIDALLQNLIDHPSDAERPVAQTRNP